jgi:hypothetical protein
MFYFNLPNSVKCEIWNNWLSPEDFFHFDSSICVAADRNHLDVFYSSVSFKIFDSMKGNLAMLDWMYSKDCFSCKKLYFQIQNNFKEDDLQLFNEIKIQDLMQRLEELTIEIKSNVLELRENKSYTLRFISILLNNSPLLVSLNLNNATPLLQIIDSETNLPMYKTLNPMKLVKIKHLTCHFIQPEEEIRRIRMNIDFEYPIYQRKRYHSYSYFQGRSDIDKDLHILNNCFTNLTTITLSKNITGKINESSIIHLINNNKALTNITIRFDVSADFLSAVTTNCLGIKLLDCDHFDARRYDKEKHINVNAFVNLVQTCTQLHTINLHNHILYTTSNDIVNIKIFGFSHNTDDKLINGYHSESIRSLFETGSFLNFILMINKEINLEIGNSHKNPLQPKEINDLCKLIRTDPTLRHLKLSIRNEDALQLLAFIPTNIKYLTIVNVIKSSPAIISENDENENNNIENIDDNNDDENNNNNDENNNNDDENNNNDENDENDESKDDNDEDDFSKDIHHKALSRVLRYKSLSSVQYHLVNGDGNVLKTRNDLLSDLLNAGLETYTPIEFNGEELWFEEKVFDLY